MLIIWNWFLCLTMEQCFGDLPMAILWIFPRINLSVVFVDNIALRNCIINAFNLLITFKWYWLYLYLIFNFLSWKVMYGVSLQLDHSIFTVLPLQMALLRFFYEYWLAFFLKWQLGFALETFIFFVWDSVFPLLYYKLLLFSFFLFATHFNILLRR